MVATPAIGAGSDGAAFDPATGYAFSSEWRRHTSPSCSRRRANTTFSKTLRLNVGAYDRALMTRPIMSSADGQTALAASGARPTFVPQTASRCWLSASRRPMRRLVNAHCLCLLALVCGSRFALPSAVDAQNQCSRADPGCTGRRVRAAADVDARRCARTARPRRAVSGGCRGCGIGSRGRCAGSRRQLPSFSATTHIGNQSNGVNPNGRFVSMDGVNMYRAWLVLHQSLSADALTSTSVRRARALEVELAARRDAQLRGLAVIVTRALLRCRDSRTQSAPMAQERAPLQAQRFLDVAQRQQRLCQVARADVIRRKFNPTSRPESYREASRARYPLD